MSPTDQPGMTIIVATPRAEIVTKTNREAVLQGIAAERGVVIPLPTIIIIVAVPVLPHVGRSTDTATGLALLSQGLVATTGTLLTLPHQSLVVTTTVGLDLHSLGPSPLQWMRQGIGQVRLRLQRRRRLTRL